MLYFLHVPCFHIHCIWIYRRVPCNINILCRREDLERRDPRGPIRAYRGRKDEKLLSLCTRMCFLCLCIHKIMGIHLRKAPSRRIILIMAESVHITPLLLFRDMTASRIHKFLDTSSHFINSLVVWIELCSEACHMWYAARCCIVYG